MAVVAHRGFSAAYPENTLRAFSAALDLGVESIELDVRLSADDHLVVLHDPTVDRTTDGTGPISALSLDEVRRLDASMGMGEWEGLPTFEEALDVIGSRCRLNVHIQLDEARRDKVARAVAETLVERGLVDSAYVASDELTLAEVGLAAPDIARCDLDVLPPESLVARAAAAGCRLIQPGHATVDREMVDAAHAIGMEVNVFYADGASEMQRIAALGVDAILTNRPDRLQQVIGTLR